MLFVLALFFIIKLELQLVKGHSDSNVHLKVRCSDTLGRRQTVESSSCQY